MKPPTEDILLKVLPRIESPAVYRDVLDHWPQEEHVPCARTLVNAFKRLERRGLVVRSGHRTKPKFTLIQRETRPRQVTPGQANWVAIKKEMGL